MDYKLISQKIAQKIKKDFDMSVLNDGYLLLKEWITKLDEDKDTIYDSAMPFSKELRKAISVFMRDDNNKNYFKEMYDLNNNLLLTESHYLFDSYMLYLEKDRKVKERFYLPRRKILLKHGIVQAIQDIIEDKLDELFISFPPRSGKTTLLMFFESWLIGINSEKANLYCAYSDTITSAMYNGVLEIVNDKHTYKWHEVFPDAKIVSTNAKEETLNIDRKKRYPSLTARSLYGTLNGAVDVNGTLIADDLIGSIEEALNKDRLASAWLKVDNNMIPRAKENAKLIWVGTRWSLADPIGIRKELVMNDEQFRTRRIRDISVPALDENDESNFDYDYGVGFSTEYYKQRRASFERNNDMASWFAQYQGEPIERSGSLFAPDDMRFFNGTLPDREPDKSYMAVDVAWGGGDFLAAPIIYEYGNDKYCVDVVFTDQDKKWSRPIIMNKIGKWLPQRIQFEKNNGGSEYAEWVENAIKNNGWKIIVTSKAAPNQKSKLERIFNKAPDIREIYFLEDGHRTKDYSMFMQNVYSFKMTGKNKHDDAPDSLAQVIEMNEIKPSVSYSVFKRPF